MIKVEEFEYEQTEKVGIEHISTGETKKGMRLIIEEVLFENQDYIGAIDFIDKAIEKLDMERQRLVNLKERRLGKTHVERKETSFNDNKKISLDEMNEIISDRKKLKTYGEKEKSSDDEMVI